MSDSRRVYRATKQAITQLYPTEPQGNLARHLNTLAGMVTGIVLSKSCQLPKMAAKAPDATQPDSREKRFDRSIIHRAKRCDLSLFQLGLRLLDHLLNEDQPLPVAFLPEPARRQIVILKNVRW